MTDKTQRINFEGKEYEIDARARFVARDSNGAIWAYEEKPAWNERRGQWLGQWGCAIGDSLWCERIANGKMFEENRPASRDSLKEVATIKVQDRIAPTNKYYAVGQRDIEQLDEGGYYTRHIYAMTHEGLYSKSDIAAELAHRDLQIDLMRNSGEEYTVVKMVNAPGSVYAFPTSDNSDGIIYEIVDGQPCRTTWMRFELLRAIEYKRAKVIGKAHVKLNIQYKQD